MMHDVASYGGGHWSYTMCSRVCRACHRTTEYRGSVREDIDYTARRQGSISWKVAFKCIHGMNRDQD